MSNDNSGLRNVLIVGEKRAVNRIGQAGFTFTEVLVAMLVLGISVMAFAGLQVRAMQTTGVSHTRSLAMSLAADLVERVRANSASAAMTAYQTTSNYNGAANPSGKPSSWGSSCVLGGTSSDGCTPDDMAKFDINEIEYQAGQLLPDGRVRMLTCPGTTNLNCVYVSWGGTAPTACTTNASTNCVAMEVLVQ